MTWLLLVATPAVAHDMWIVPATFAAPPDETVAVSLRLGHAGAAEPVARDGRRIVRFTAIRLDDGPETLEVAGLDGRDPAGWVRPTSPGLYALVYEGEPAYSELDGARFTAYLEEEGLDHVARARTDAGAASTPGRELFSRSLKSLLRVGDSAGGVDRDRPVGLPLELVLERVDAAGAVALRLLWRGEPLAGALVDLRPLGAPARPASTATTGPATTGPAATGPAATSTATTTASATASSSGDGGERSCRTDDAGRCALVLAAGDWLAAAVHMEPAAGDDRARADWRSWFATLTFRLDEER